MECCVGGSLLVVLCMLKPNPTQAWWSTIKKKAYATAWALQKFRKWIFGKPAVSINQSISQFLRWPK